MTKKQTKLFEKKSKKVNIISENPECKMELRVSGKYATENASKIVKAFEKACEDISENKHLIKTKNSHMLKKGVKYYVCHVCKKENEEKDTTRLFNLATKQPEYLCRDCWDKGNFFK